jgi:AAA domain
MANDLQLTFVGSDETTKQVSDLIKQVLKERRQPTPRDLVSELDDKIGVVARWDLESVTKLTWHYRSRHESLISFCNRAFYAGELNTVPGRRPIKTEPEIVIGELPIPKRVQAAIADNLLERPVSTHRVEAGVYRNQQNEAEAQYVAELVRSLLKKKTRKSVGVVAFSQPQAQAIEGAIDALAEVDKAFANLVESERERHIDGQFTGLFVKNLESVQGDERDIIIVSVGYAPGPDGKMRMNFGPINQGGGAKRLNVIFSRAKQHIAIITSIGHRSITNDYNVGANTLKQYLRYAEAVSRGDEGEMHACLNGLGETGPGSGVPRAADDAVAAKIAAELEGQGLLASRNFGHSMLQIDVAVRKPDENEYARAILVDTMVHYAIPDAVERYVTRPAILRAFGWDVEQVLGKDWVLRQVGSQQTRSRRA